MIFLDTIFILSILFFFVLFFGLGFTLLRFFSVSLDDDFITRSIIYLGTGLGFFVILSVFLTLLNIPLNWWFFLIFSLLTPAYFLLRHGVSGNIYSFNFVLKKEYLFYAVVFFAAVILGFNFLNSAYSYNYLEDDDPWEHAVAVRWIADTGSYIQENPEQISHYLEPYPPSYDVLLSLMYQINGTVYNTLKFFNILLIVLGILFFFLFAKEMFGIRAGCFATLLLVALPSWISHFIWSHTLAMVLFPFALFVAFRAATDQQWQWPAIFLVAAMMVIHPFVSVLFGVFYAFFVAWQCFFVIREKRKHSFWNPFTNSFFVGFMGVVLSFFYWGQQILKYGLHEVLYSHSGGFGGVAQIGQAQTAIQQYINPVYTLHDFLFVPIYTKIDQPTGFGIAAFILVCASLLFLLFHYKQYFHHNKLHFVVLLWFLFSFTGLLSGHLPFSILTHRFWAYVSIPFALLAGFFVDSLLAVLKPKQRMLLLCMLFLAIFGVPFSNTISLAINPDYNISLIFKGIREHPVLGVITAIDVLSSWQPKKAALTMQWPPGIGWNSIDELNGYMWMHDNLAGYHVLSLCKDERFLFGFDMETNFPSPVMESFRSSLGTQTIESIVAVASSYDYVSFEYSCVSSGYLSEEKLNNLANSLAKIMDVAYQGESMIVYSTKPRI